MTSLQLTNLLKEHGAELLRFLILQSHYRSPIDFSEETLKSARTGIKTFYRLLERLERTAGFDPYKPRAASEVRSQGDHSPPARKLLDETLNLRVRFLEAMDDDFNTAAAIAVLFELSGAINRFIDESRLETSVNDEAPTVVEAAGGTFMSLAHLLGLFVERPAAAADQDTGRTPKLLDLLVTVRRKARELKQYQLADYVRDELTQLGVVLEDRPDGTHWRID
jgi:cysteinyl-tRNA synthetase